LFDIYFFETVTMMKAAAVASFREPLGIGEVVELGSNVGDNIKKKVILLVFLGFKKLIFIVNIV